MHFNENLNSVNDQLGWDVDAESSENFARKLTEKLEKRLEEHEKSERKTRKERHAIFSQCFEEIIRQNGCFGPLLSEIKVEYENCIGAVLRSERDADFLYRSLTSCVSGTGTIKNYKKQIKDLEIKFRMLLEQNKRLRHPSLIDMNPNVQKSGQLLQDIYRSLAAIRGQSFHGMAPTNLGFGKFRVKLLQRYTAMEQTNIDFLKEELERLRKEIQELVKFFDKRFKLRKTKDRLIETLVEKEHLKNDLKEQGNILKSKLLKLEERLKEERKKRDLVTMKKPKTIVELILLTLKYGEAEDDFIDKIEEELKEGKESSEEEDNVGEQEHEEMVEYMEKFEQLFTQGSYEEAATVAATSPQDILRTAQTFERFKEQKAYPGEKSPLLHYCEAVIVNCSTSDQKGLTASESVDAVVRALHENQQGLVLQWLSQDKLKYSECLGDSIVAFCRCDQVCTCGFYTLAEAVYRQTKTHGKVVACLCRQGRLNMAVSHARNLAKFRKVDFMKLLEMFPSFTHAQILLLVGDGYLSSPLCREECMTSLVRAHRLSDAARLLQSVHDRIRCSKIITHLLPEHEKAWAEFCEVLIEQGFASPARDLLSAWILAGVFKKALFQIGL